MSDFRTAFGEKSPSYDTLRRWYKFESEVTSVADEAHTGRPKTVTNERNVGKVSKVLDADRRLTAREVVTKTKLSRASVHRIITLILGQCNLFV